MLQVPELEAPPAPWVARLRYAYADALLAVGRGEEAREWFARAAEADTEVVTDAAERLLELDGVALDEVEPVAEDPAEEQPAGKLPPSSGRSPWPSLPSLTTTVPRRRRQGRWSAATTCCCWTWTAWSISGRTRSPGAVEAIERLHKDGLRVMYATNNASRTPEEVATILVKLGVAAAAEDVVTSAMAAAAVLRERLRPGSPVLVVGAEALAAALSRVGLQPVTSADERPAAVVQGYAPEVGWQQLAEASVAIRAGAQWIATNTDATLPTPRGPLPGNGSLVAALRTALEREPDLVVGKPQPTIFETAIQLAGHSGLVVGDRLDTDIAGAHRAGLDSLLVFTGVTTEEDLASASPQQRPTYLGADLGALFAPPVRP